MLSNVKGSGRISIESRYRDIETSEIRDIYEGNRQAGLIEDGREDKGSRVWKVVVARPIWKARVEEGSENGRRAGRTS
jgi:hypothetical protein